MTQGGSRTVPHRLPATESQLENNVILLCGLLILLLLHLSVAVDEAIIPGVEAPTGNNPSFEYFLHATLHKLKFLIQFQLHGK